MAKDHGPSVKDDKQYEGLREKGMGKARAARNRQQQRAPQNAEAKARAAGQNVRPPIRAARKPRRLQRAARAATLPAKAADAPPEADSRRGRVSRSRGGAAIGSGAIKQRQTRQHVGELLHVPDARPRQHAQIVTSIACGLARGHQRVHPHRVHRCQLAQIDHDRRARTLTQPVDRSLRSRGRR